MWFHQRLLTNPPPSNSPAPAANNPLSEDHPRLRAASIGCLCRREKQVSLVVCWECYRGHRFRLGNPYIEKLLDEAEANEPIRSASNPDTLPNH
jgi:hypothetical protein